MDELILLIKQFDTVLAEKAPFLHQKLNEPIERETIVSILDRMNVRDNDLLQLYSWRNGISYLPTEYTLLYDFSAEGVLLPLDHVISLCYPEDDYHLWDEGYIPIIGNYEGDYLLYNSNSNNEFYGMLFLYSKSALSLDPMWSYYDSISSMLISITECFKSGTFQYTKQSGLEIDIDKMVEINKRINKKSSYWQQFE